MNSFLKNKLGSTNTNRPTIRKETVLVPVKPQSTPRSPQVPRSASSTPSTSNRSAPPTSRFQLSGTPRRKSPPEPAKRAIANSRGVKRKSATPQPDLPVFSDSDGGSDSDDASAGASDSDISRKRMKSSVSSITSNTSTRNIILAHSSEEPEFVHSEALTSGIYENKFKSPWTDEAFETVSLQYPSRCQEERFQLKWPKQGSDEYRPFDDIKETIKYVVTCYFPSTLAEQYSDDSSGFERRLNRAWQKQSAADWIAVMQEYNNLVKRLVADGTIQKQLASMHELDLELVKRILDQIYSRTVSLRVESLKAYKTGTDNVYGELLPRFVREIFDKTRLNHDQVFVDLGSGVGNVVLQAALDVGCESWGIEMMPSPCALADLQAQEFAARTQLWGLATGKVSLLKGDFTENRQIAEVLKRADLVLVNNQAFTSDLNEKLTTMFLDLKDGAQVVSLKPFVPEGHRISTRNIGSPVNQFRQIRFEWFADYVSWGGNGGHYYIATKDTRPLEQFMKKHNIR